MRELLERATQFEPDLIALRRHFHKYPELSFHEQQTAEEVATRVSALGYRVTRNVGRTGVVAELDNGAGPCVALRADMDALPIQEQNEVDYRSSSPGVMHACGHDAHMTMLIGAARLLADLRSNNALPRGKVRLLFQPSEEASDAENKSGATRMIEDGALEDVDAVFGLHVGGHLAAGKFFLRAGPMMAGSDTFSATVMGKSAHAARPHEGIDAVVLAAHAVLACQNAVARHISPFHQGVLTIGMISGGTAENVIADRVVLRGTIRYFDDDVRKTLRQELRNGLRVAETLGGRIELDLRDGYPPVVNDVAMNDLAHGSIVQIFGTDSMADFEPMMGAEDFALMQREAPGAFIWLGAAPGKPREHHHPEFNIDETVLVKGASALAGIAVQALKTL
ncbi:MAG TPA: M20 family metallopeptidase [Longimicrobiales bacterium]|nr:M20 family metallopeptidase [Longimicrobiales bacterium]